MTAPVETRTAAVRVAGVENLVHVPIADTGKPAVPESFERKWQEIVTLAARIVDVPAGLIMRLLEREIEVFASSATEGNPYEPGEKAELGLGLYCETVVGRRAELLVPHALADPDWRSNPDVELDMYSYLGVPIRWPDGEVFGTFCVLDRQRNEYDDDQRQLVRRLADLVENDLKTIAETNDVLGKAELEAREIRHRIKNQFNLLISYIDLDAEMGSAGPDGRSIAEALKRRIKTLATVHEQMSYLPSGSTVPLLAYLREIVTLLVSSAPFEIEVTARGAEVFVDERTLIPIASIVNELVTNSVKHAFEGVSRPALVVDVQYRGDRVCIEYCDNGTRTDADGTDDRVGLGEMIIRSLVAQLSGTLERDGFVSRICVPGARPSHNHST
ncbi:MAG: sensor histidine kinase [Spirochaetota bacterium]